MKAKSLNRNLGAAKAAKQDEFYTQYVDIQKEVEAYLELDPDTFRGKVVYCNCDDPFESNFFKYFAANFNKLGLKKLIATSYDGSPIAGQGTSSRPAGMTCRKNSISPRRCINSRPTSGPPRSLKPATCIREASTITHCG